jgi:hypothetical protein
VALVSALVPVAAVDWSLVVPAVPAVLAPVPVADVEPAPEGVVLLGALGLGLVLVDGWPLALVELEGCPLEVVWAIATAPSAKAPATPAMVAIFIRRYSLLR